jgi:methylated-DNA-[protein]-cysteine S-methyltransferase
MKVEVEGNTVIVFETGLGWMSLWTRGDAVRQLSFGHATADVAGRAIECEQPEAVKLSRGHRRIVNRLVAFAEGEAVDFDDLAIDLEGMTEFQSHVLTACRHIGYGQVVTYGELAGMVEHPGAARAVGNCMASNRVPLIIPCHRVVRAGGEVGPYSAAGGSATKRQLLEMEAAAVGHSAQFV